MNQTVIHLKNGQTIERDVYMDRETFEWYVRYNNKRLLVKRNVNVWSEL